MNLFPINTPLLNFFIVGQPKSGTTALHAFLSEHPDIFLTSVKEPHIFCTDMHAECDAFLGPKIGHDFFPFRTEEDIQTLFSQAKNESILGEGSVHYLYSKAAAQRIYDYNPQAKILMVFREPSSFLFSLYHQFRSGTIEHLPTFEEALAAEEDRKQGKKLSKRAICPSHLFYSERVRYSDQVKRFTSLFPPSQIKLLLFDDFVADNAAVYKEILSFLEVDPSFTANWRIVNKGNVPRSQLLNTIARSTTLKILPKRLLSPLVYNDLRVFIKRLLLRPNARKERILPETELQLKQAFLPEIERFSEVIGENLVERWGYSAIQKKKTS